MSIEVGSTVKPRTDKDNLGLGKIKRAVERKPSDGPRTYRWIAEFTLPNGSKGEREFTSRQLELQASTVRKQATAKQNGKKKTGPSRNQRRKARKRQAEKPLSEEASALMQAMLTAAGGEKNGANAVDPKNNGISDSSDTDDSQKQTTKELPSQPLLSDPEYSSSSSETSAITRIDSKTISKGSRVKTRSGGRLATVVKAKGRWM